MTEKNQMEKTKRAFGMWDSQITPELIAAAIGVADPQWDTDGQTLVWREGRSGKGVLMAQPLGEAPYEISGEKNVSGGVGYGGGDFTIQDDLVIFAAKDGRLYRRPLGAGFPEPITPQYGSVASPKLSPGNAWVAFIHNYEGKDVVGLVDSQGENWPVKLAKNADFYMQPVWHPSGEAIAWVEWDHPNMPWDGTRLMYAVLEGNPPRIQAVQQLAGGANIPILQPAFSSDGRYLTYVQNQGEWDQLILRDLQDGSLKTLVEGASILKPAWIQGVVVQFWSADNEHVYFVQTQAGVNTISKLNVKTGALEDVDMHPYTSLSQPSVSVDERLAVVAGAPSISPRVVSKKGEKLTIHQRSTSESIPTGDLPTPYEISWTSSDGEEVYGIYSPPTSSRLEGDGLPPAIVLIHGGPTSSVSIGYNLEAAFFTSRGYAYLEVNYRGSTGYGRAYREALRGNWGHLDVIDAAGGAQALIDQHLADPNRLVIKGGSAGGYTVLNTLIRFPGLYKAGICSYGVTNLFTLAMDTHKFEERYTDSLVGPLPEAAEKYRNWSPVFHADKIKDPVAIFQGEEDKVVPPCQSEEIVKALKANGVPHEYHLYPGEGHGFRKSETRQAYYEAIERFLLQYVIFG
ncbi:MAG: S9 family peptidase [Brevefilum sp.]|nr:S9 family peptidase [Brevefilum sp.]MDT8381611.1 S9 family peptidase [Brevefilum sp.]MDW7753845.1 S9 family peptidase [Brevefilum sp.]